MPRRPFPQLGGERQEGRHDHQTEAPDENRRRERAQRKRQKRAHLLIAARPSPAR